MYVMFVKLAYILFRLLIDTLPINLNVIVFDNVETVSLVCDS